MMREITKKKDKLEGRLQEWKTDAKFGSSSSDGAYPLKWNLCKRATIQIGYRNDSTTIKGRRCGAADRRKGRLQVA